MRYLRNTQEVLEALLGRIKSDCRVSISMERNSPMTIAVEEYLGGDLFKFQKKITREQLSQAGMPDLNFISRFANEYNADRRAASRLNRSYKPPSHFNCRSKSHHIAGYAADMGIVDDPMSPRKRRRPSSRTNVTCPQCGKYELRYTHDQIYICNRCKSQFTDSELLEAEKERETLPSCVLCENGKIREHAEYNSDGKKTGVQLKCDDCDFRALK
ncbi:MAG: hypothetical protein GY861_24190 [bacterium]|nr:hypothetical protein [bacterium]